MNQMETYLFLLTDSFMTGLVLPAKHSLVFSSMRIFGGYNLYIASFISTIGITLAACVNWLLGRALCSLKKDHHITKENPQISRILGFLKIHGYWAGLLGFIPILGPLLTVFAGVIQTSFRRIIILVFVVNLLWHYFNIL